MSGLNELSMNMAAALARKAKERPRWVKMKRLPSTRSRPNPRSERSRREGARETVSRAIIAAEKRKLPASIQKQAFSLSQATSAPASAGERMRTA